MTLRINDIAPDFTASTTQGQLHFHSWIGDGWAILFSHPKDFTPVCTTELGYMAQIEPEFRKRNCKQQQTPDWQEGAMVFEQIASGGCQSYLIGCAETCAASLIDPEVSQLDRYLALAARDGLRIRYVIDTHTHTHADHFSARQQLAGCTDTAPADRAPELAIEMRASAWRERERERAISISRKPHDPGE